MRCAAVMAGLVLLCCAAGPAPAQATRPAPPASPDPYLDAPLPARRGAATQGSGQGGAGNASPSDPLELKRLGVALLVVIGAIFVTHRVWKRMGMPGSGGKASGPLQVVSRLSLSPKQQILLVRVGQRLVLIGNSGTQMNSLCEISNPDEAAAVLGQSVAERDEAPSSFSAALGDEERSFENAAAAGEADAEMETTREELSGMMDKVRNLSKQFKRA